MTIGHDLIERGYKPGGYNDIDDGVCKTSTCEVCGHEGMEYRPFVKTAYDGVVRIGYIAVAVCPKCKYEVEF